MTIVEINMKDLLTKLFSLIRQEEEEKKEMCINTTQLDTNFTWVLDIWIFSRMGGRRATLRRRQRQRNENEEWLVLKQQRLLNNAIETYQIHGYVNKNNVNHSSNDKINSWCCKGAEATYEQGSPRFSYTERSLDLLAQVHWNSRATVINNLNNYAIRK